MKASLDTNVIIHMYEANIFEILYEVFEEGLYVHEFIRNVELVNHGSSVIGKFDKDVVHGRIIIVTEDYLRSKGVLTLFNTYLNQEKRLYPSSDMGEIYEIALARTLGAFALVTDDIKMYGPHYTLIQIPDSEVMPFAFHEVLLLDLLMGNISCIQFVDFFNAVNASANLNWNLKQKLTETTRRFLDPPCQDMHEMVWLEEFCKSNNVNFKNIMRGLLSYVE